MSEEIEYINFKFKPTPLDELSAPKQLGLTVLGLGALATSKAERASQERPQGWLPDWSIVLKTPEGICLKLERSHYKPVTICFMFPDPSLGQIPELVKHIFGAEPAELSAVSPENGIFPGKGQIVRDTFRLPYKDSEDRHYWLEGDQTRAKDLSIKIKPRVEQIVVFGQKIGELVVAQEGIMHNIALVHSQEPYSGVRYTEDTARFDTDNLSKISYKFAEFAISVANQHGGANEITLPYEYGKLKPNFTATPSSVMARFVANGYKVSLFQRKPSEVVEPGFYVIKATKPTVNGQETIFAELYVNVRDFSRGGTGWRFTKGVTFNEKATIDDLRRLLPK